MLNLRYFHYPYTRKYKSSFQKIARILVEQRDGSLTETLRSRVMREELNIDDLLILRCAIDEINLPFMVDLIDHIQRVGKNLYCREKGCKNMILIPIKWRDR